MNIEYKKYFSKSRCRIAPLLAMLFGDRKIVGAEIGVWKGRNACKLLTQMPNLTIIGVDMWDLHKGVRYNTPDRIIQKMFNSKYALRCYDIAVQSTAVFSERCKLIKLASKDAASCYEDHYFDFIYIDANHAYKQCKADLLCWLPKIKIGGYLCGHDFRNKRHRVGIQRAVHKIVNLTGLDMAYNKNVNGEWIVGPVDKEFSL